MPGISNLIISINGDIEFKIPYHLLSVRQLDCPNYDFYRTDNKILAAKLAKATEIITRVYSGVSDPFNVIDIAASKYYLKKKVEELKSGVTFSNTVDRVKSACMLGIIESAYMAKHHSVYLPENLSLPQSTVIDIDTMARRGADYLSKRGGVIGRYLGFEDAYTDNINMGYSNYLVQGGFVFVTPSVNGYYDTHFQRLLIETLMARRSHLPVFQKNDLDILTVFNSRFNRAYFLDYSAIPKKTIDNYLALIGYKK